MASIQIPNLTAAIALNGDEQMEAVQAGSSVRVTTAQIAQLQSPFLGSPLTVPMGGTGLGSGTSGGILYFNSTNTMASSAALALNALVIGGGTGGAPSTTATGTGVLTALGVNVGSAGAFVVNGGALGTPSSGTLTSCTGLPLSTGITGFGTGVATALAVNIGSAGAPVLFNGAGGTPSSLTLTNATGLPVSTGVSGLGTGVATALAVNVGSAGALVANGGVLGTPSSGTLTNCTGLPVSTGISGLGTGVATALATAVNGSGAISLTTSPTFVTPVLGAATGTSLALGGATLGSNALAITGLTAITTPSTTTGQYINWYNGTNNVATIGGYSDSTTAGHLEFYTTTGAVATERLRIDSAGAIWPIVNSTVTSQYIAFGNGTSQFGMIGGYYDSATTGHLELYALASGTSATEVVRVYPAGVSIKTGAAPTAYLTLAAGTATASTAPLKLTSGTNLTAAEAGAVEYDGSFLYFTPGTTSGRGYTPAIYDFRLTANASAQGATIFDYFGSTSSINLEASAVYEIEIYAYFTKTTSGTATWTLAASSAPTLMSGFYTACPVTGIAAGAPITGYTGSAASTTAAFAATAALTTAVNHWYYFKVQVITNLATNFRLQLTQSAGTATPLAGSYYRVHRIAPSTGSFAA